MALPPSVMTSADIVAAGGDTVARNAIATGVGVSAETLVGAAKAQVDGIVAQVIPYADAASADADRAEAAAQNALNYGNAAIRSGYVAADAETWTAGAWVQVLSSDTGTHTPKAGDYNPGGGNTPNAGVYQEDASLGLVRKAATVDVLAAQSADDAQAAAASVATLTPTITDSALRLTFQKWVSGDAYYIGDSAGYYVSKTDGSAVLSQDALRSMQLSLAASVKWAPGSSAQTGDTAGYYTQAVGASGSGAGTKPILDLIIAHGQSLTVGNPSPITTSKGMPTLSMFNGGVLVVGDTINASTVLDPASVVAMVPLKAGATKETFLESLAETLHLNTGANVIVASTGVGGQAYFNLRKGTIPYANMIACVTAAQAFAVALGAHCRMTLCWQHGEADFNVSRATYSGYLAELIANVNSDVIAITGQEVVQVFAGQSPSLSQSQVPIALSDLSRTEAKLHLIGPLYDLPLADAQHPTGLGYHHLGLKYERCIRRVMFEKLPWKPYEMKSAVLSGSTITVTMEGQTGLPQIDTTGVADRGIGKGFEYFDDAGSPVTVTGVTATVTGYTVTLSGSPTGTAGSRRMRTAYTSTTTPTGTTNAPAGATGSIPGARTNLCDQDGLVDTAASTTFPMPKRMIIDEITVV